MNHVFFFLMDLDVIVSRFESDFCESL